MKRMQRRALVVLVAAAFVILAGVATAVSASAGNGPDTPILLTTTTGEHSLRVPLCHATDSRTNPFVAIVVNVHSIETATDVGGHDKHAHDIIPPFTFGEFHYPGKNWTVLGQEIFRNRCAIPCDVRLGLNVDSVITLPHGCPTTTTTHPCIDPDIADVRICPTTTTTAKPTTTTTEHNGETTTTVHNGVTSTTVLAPPDTGHAGTPVAPAVPFTPTASHTGPLPFTGSDALPLTLAGAGLAAVGLMLARGSRRGRK